MIVIALSICTPALKGDLTKWLFEIAPGVYVGDVSARVRDRLWERIENSIGSGRACMVYGVRSETHFALRTLGDTWDPVDFDGITLMRHPRRINYRDATSPKSKPVKRIAKAKHQNLGRKKKIPDDYVVIDLETTGLDPETDQIIEIAMVRVKQNTISEQLRILVKIVGRLPGFIVKLTGITDRQLNDEGIPPEEALKETIQFIGSNPVVGHNVGFDLSFLQNLSRNTEIQLPKLTTVDTLKLARERIRGIPNYRLNTLIDYLGLSSHPSHEGIEDCLAVHGLLCELKKIRQNER
ncbi:type I-E CRISPR-associated endoribonuclease Cas2e [uncultured Faecalibaculum sp.]|uniref:type I-E CRISPR-associated endoribonuclease Cas2e n=1 Tax=uncultured Faecalibaculum sp. TaxID=1729681 RepID=UPI0025E9FFCE|nr:type I-E CRISPR-associated endoribonuclease Cas2e [uncultured Faecalibaculum sp.]